MKNFKFKIIFLIVFLSIINADEGDLISYNQQNTLSLFLIDLLLDGAGISDSNPIYPISIYDIQYESHRPDGTIDTLAGLISIPLSPLEAFPILSYQHGTVVLDNNAPSITGATINNYEVLSIALIASPSGMITLFPDYEGLGDPNKYHPYIIADSYTRAVVNMVRAVKELSFTLEGDDKFQFNEQLFLFGYSEGGYATLAAQKGIQLDYPEEFTVTVSCPMAGPYDLSETMVDYFLSIPTYPNPYYVPYVLTSHLWYYEGLEVDFDNYFEPFWADTLPSLYDGTHSSSEINQLMPENPLDILTDQTLDDFINNDDHFFRESLRTNTLLDWAPESPTYFFHGIGDDNIPFENAQVAYDVFITNGASDINLISYPEEMGGHGEVAGVAIFDAYITMLNYQLINPLGDFDGDAFLSIEDINFLTQTILYQEVISDYQWWAGDIDYDDDHTILDILHLSDLVQN